MKYRFLNEFGQIEETNNLKKFCGLSWSELNHIYLKGDMTKKEKDFLEKYGFKSTIFNVAIFQHIRKVYLHDFDYNRLKGGLKNE